MKKLSVKEVEGWDSKSFSKRILEKYAQMCIKGKHRNNGAVILQTVPTWVYEVVIPEITILLSHSLAQAAVEGERKRILRDLFVEAGVNRQKIGEWVITTTYLAQKYPEEVKSLLQSQERSEV